MISHTRAALAALTVSFLWSPALLRPAAAADGNLDSSFGIGGQVTTDVNASFDNAKAVAIQPDGKIVVAGSVFGSSSAPGVSDFAVARYNSDGSLDATFGTDGKVQIDFATSYDETSALALQPDGKIIVAGRATPNDGSDDFGLIRLDANGALDTAFGNGGKVATDFGSAFLEQATGVALQSDGKIVAVGYTYTFDTGTDFALARYNPDGSLDATFGNGGKVITTVVGNGLFDQALAVAIQGDGKIVATGSATVSAEKGSNFVVIRYDTSGALDASFGAGGIVDIDFGSTQEVAYAVALQPDGKIVAAGVTHLPAHAQFALARYNVDGTLDTTFGVGGFTTVSADPDIEATAFGVGVQYDGKIVAAGSLSFTSTGAGTFGVGRFNADGSLDTSFGIGGGISTGFGNSVANASGMAIQPDGRIVVVGSATLGSAIGSADFAIARYEGPPLHTLTFFLHGNDMAGTAGGFTMNGTPPMSQSLPIGNGSTSTWFSDPAVSGAFLAGTSVRLVTPCPTGVGMPKTVTLASTNLDGSDPQLLGQASQGVVICLGQESLSLMIPVTTPTTLINRRLQLTIATGAQELTLPLGQGTFLEATTFVGAP
jgi:uncharacterized delta-60 repeat protein